jgi:hypothetical protein
MRFMLLMIPGGYESAGPELDLPVDRVAAMMQFNESLQKAGVLISCEGLHPPASGARVRFTAGKATVTDGPFPEAKEVLGGFWILDVRSREEAIEWARRCPASDAEMIEVRRLQEMEDFTPEVQVAASGFAELRGRTA